MLSFSFITWPEMSLFYWVWDKQRGLIKTLELEKKKEATERNFFESTPPKHLPRKKLAPYSPLPKLTSEVNVNIIWIIYEQGWLLCLWMVMIYKYTENRHLLSSSTFTKPSSLKPSICRNNIHFSLKTNNSFSPTPQM